MPTDPALTDHFRIRNTSLPALLSLLTMLCTVPDLAQFRPQRTFGAVQTFEQPLSTLQPIAFRFSSLKYPDLLCQDSVSSSFRVYNGDGKGTFLPGRVIARSPMVTSFTAGPLNDDALDDLVVVHRETNQVEVFISKRNDSSYTATSYPVNYYPEHALISDLNNDRIPDILCFGKLSTGISYLQGKGNGTFYPARTLFENIPVSDASVISLNGDQYPDIAVQNWLTNETVIYLGLGRLKFVEQTVLSFGADTVLVRFLDVNNDRLSDAVVVSSRDRTVQLLTGDGLGNFSFQQALPTTCLPGELHRVSVSTTAAGDIIVRDPRSPLFSLFLGGKKGKFQDETVYGLDPEVRTILPCDVNGDGYSDLLMLRGNGASYDVMWNGHREPEQGSAVRYPVGGKPVNIAVNDVNGDGIDDVIVTNAATANLSLLISSPSSPYGQISLETADDPVSASMYSRSDSTVTLYSSHGSVPKISVLSLRSSKDTTLLAGEMEQFAIPLPDRPITVLPDVSFMDKGLSLYAFLSSRSNALMFYRQVKGTRFLTRNLVPSIPSTFLSSTINDLNSDGKADLITVYTDERNENGKVSVTLNDSVSSFSGPVETIPLADSIVRRAFLWIEDVNGDHRKDILLFTAPRNELSIALANGPASHDIFRPVLSVVTIRQQEQVQLTDFDNDGILDILYHDREKEELRLLKGKGNGGFRSPVVLADIPKESVVRCADINGDGSMDIIFTNPRSASVTVLYGSHE